LIVARVGLREWLAVGAVIASGRTIRYGDKAGRHTDRFEARLAAMTGAKYALAVNSGTTALISALAGAGIGPGDEVLVPAYTWIATAAAPVAVGAVPILVDIDETMTIDPADIERKITPYTRAIMPVHMGNVVCNMAAVMEIARRRNLIVIEDACQAVGLRYREQYLGAIGTAGAFSFNSYKNINIGEGGAVLSSDERLFQRARMYHDGGAFARGHDRHNEPFFVGMNFKASEFDGAMLNVQLSKLGPLVRRLRQRHDMMAEIMSGSGVYRIGPHNDLANACGLHVIFETSGEAEAFASARRGVQRLIDSGRHVYTNWEAIMERRSFHPRMNAWLWANRDINYSADMCSRTLDLLSRTCRIALGAQYPAALMRYFAKGHASWRPGATAA
jgi:dTDP-4-amino-4,6-dideoxygalactose transaminase